jgi:2-methylfumaryl-CoA hydratase
MSFTRLFQNSARVHFDPAAAGGSHLVYGGVVISLGYALSHNGMENRFGIRAINAGSHVQPVRAGDTLYACTDVLECHPVSPDWGAARLRMVVTRNSPLHLDAPITVADPGTGREHHAADVVLDLDYWDLIARRRSG